MKKDYWQGRFEKAEQKLFNMGASAYATIEKSFRKAQKETQNQIETWYNRIAQNNNITLLQAKRKLKGNELDEFRWTVDEYIAKAKENAVNQKWIQELENASARAHITRLEALQLHTQQLLEVAFANQLDTVDNMVKAVYMESFNRASWILQTGINTAAFMGEIDERQLDKIIKRPWTVDGKEFSERIWGNRTVMINELHQEMIRTLIRGGTPDEAIKHMAKFVDGEGKSAMRKAARLVQTEQAYFSTISKMESYKELDVEQYQIIATFDLQTSKKCQEMDKQVFKVEEMHVGVNAPPFHPNCRTTTAPYHDKVYFKSTRAARDGDGKTIQVPEDMTYAEWYEEYGRKYQAKVDEQEGKRKEREKKKKQKEKEKEKKELPKGENGDTMEQTNTKINKDTTKDKEFFVSNQTEWVTDKEHSNVNRKFVNSKAFHDNFEHLTDSKAVNESLYQESLKILERRDGTQFEDLVAIDSKTGKVLAKNTTSEELGRTKFTEEEYMSCVNNANDIVLLHNHPASGRPSDTDIKSLFKHNIVSASVVVGHDGSVYMISNADRKMDVEDIWGKAFEKYKYMLGDSDIAKAKATTGLYESNIFDYKKRRGSND